MFRYLKAAFLVRQRIPLLGGVPINFLIITATAVLGLAHPAFWLLGAAAEGALLWSLVASARFRKLVDAQALQTKQQAATDAREAMEPQLRADGQAKLNQLRQALQRIEQDYAAFAPDDETAAENLRNLHELETCYFKLLAAQQHLSASEGPNNRNSRNSIAQQLAELESSLADPQLPAALRSSQDATRSLLQQRLSALEQRQNTLREISSDLDRIEAQVNLAADAAAVHAKPATLSFDVDFASRMIAMPELYAPTLDAPQRTSLPANEGATSA